MTPQSQYAARQHDSPRNATNSSSSPVSVEGALESEWIVRGVFEVHLLQPKDSPGGRHIAPPVVHLLSLSLLNHTSYRRPDLRDPSRQIPAV